MAATGEKPMAIDTGARASASRLVTLRLEADGQAAWSKEVPTVFEVPIVPEVPPLD